MFKLQHDGPVHFHSSDDRFCGCKTVGRQFTLDPNDVTCQACMDNDCFVLSESGQKYLASEEVQANIRAADARRKGA